MAGLVIIGYLGIRSTSDTVSGRYVATLSINNHRIIDTLILKPDYRFESSTFGEGKYYFKSSLLADYIIFDYEKKGKKITYQTKFINSIIGSPSFTFDSHHNYKKL